MTSPWSLEQLLEQEQLLQFSKFNHHTAWQLGSRIKSLADDQKAAIALEVYAFNQVLFSYAMAGTTADNQTWIARKRASVLRFGHSSFYLGEYNRSKGRQFEQQPQIDPMVFAAHGGSFPLRIRNSGLIGAVTVSGLPQEDDHGLVIEALYEMMDG